MNLKSSEVVSDLNKPYSKSTPLKAVIFDMDGVLIDSEPIWRESEITVFAEVGVYLTEEMCFETMGLRIDEVVRYWCERYPWEDFEMYRLENRIVDTVINLITVKGETKEGVHEAIEFFQGRELKIALASSSSYRIIQTVLDKLGIEKEFGHIYSAEDEQYGKPHPGVYLTTAQKLGVIPTECLAIEDSLNGVLSAKSARMKCVAIPEPLSRQDPRFIIADITLKSLLELNEETWKGLNG